MKIKKTFIFQNELPMLPIPPLDSTKSKLLEWIEPLVTEQQFKKTSDVIEHFFQTDGEASKLQAKLHEWDQSRSGSWLTPFWDDAYLKHRDPLPYKMNFNVLLKNDRYEGRYTVAEMAGRVSFLVAELYHAIIDEKVSPSMIKGQPLDMSQYKNFFRSVRIPRFERDTFHVADFDKRNNHVVILYRKNIYQVQVTDHKGVIYHNLDIAAAIEAMIQEEQDEGINGGIFTTANRNMATKAYSSLRASRINKETLGTIADSLVIISIDEESKKAEETIRNLMLCGDNKYFDKTIQVIITKQCELGFNIEHSAVDGTSISTVISYVSKGLKKETSLAGRTFVQPIIEKKKWELSNELLKMFAQFQKDHLNQKNNYDLQSNIFTAFGASEIKKMNLSPDAFFHMALQIAQYRTYGEFKSVYEPVSVRFFYEGRTECARATSIEKQNLVRMLEKGNENNETLYSYMRKASVTHSKRIRDCQKGFGVERHMYGLEQMHRLFGEELGISKLPQIFQDKGYLTMRHDFISTSGMAYENVKYRMFGPVVNGGHGVAYIILDDSISINISSYIDSEEKASQLMRHMVSALNELREIAREHER